MRPSFSPIHSQIGHPTPLLCLYPRSVLRMDDGRCGAVFDTWSNSNLVKLSYMAPTGGIRDSKRAGAGAFVWFRERERRGLRVQKTDPQLRSFVNNWLPLEL